MPAGSGMPSRMRSISSGSFDSMIEAKEPAEIEAILDGIPDPTGQFYRFNLADSLLRASTKAWKR